MSRKVSFSEIQNPEDWQPPQSAIVFCNKCNRGVDSVYPQGQIGIYGWAFCHGDMEEFRANDVVEKSDEGIFLVFVS